MNIKYGWHTSINRTNVILDLILDQTEIRLNSGYRVYCMFSTEVFL